MKSLFLRSSPALLAAILVAGCGGGSSGRVHCGRAWRAKGVLVRGWGVVCLRMWDAVQMRRGEGEIACLISMLCRKPAWERRGEDGHGVESATYT